MLTEKLIIEYQTDELVRDYFSVFMPPPDRSLSQWADEERYIAAGTSSEPGKWKTSRVEYMRQPMDTATSGEYNKLILMGGTQWGKTEFLLNLLGFYISEDPSPILFINPSKDSADDFSEERFTPMVEATPCLRSKIEPNKSRDSKNTINNKKFKNDAHIAFVGSNVPNDVASRSRRIIIGDEIDRWALSAGKDGDVISLARQRLKNWWNSFEALASTPVDFDTSVIYREWLGSDQRHRHYKCPDCGHSHHLEWENVKWDGDDINTSPETALYHCPGCGVGWNDVTRWRLDKTGIWIKSNPDSKIAGFHISQLYSPWVKLSTMVYEFIEAKGKPLMEKVFRNTVLGLPYEDRIGADVDVEHLMARREHIPEFTMPERAALLTAGVDVSGDRVDVQITAFGLNNETWALDNYKIFGDPSGQKLWEDLYTSLRTRKYKHPISGQYFSIEATAVDSGYMTTNVYKFCARMQLRGLNVYATKGVPGEGKPLWKHSEQKIKFTKLFLIGADDAKTMIFANLAIEEGESHIHFSDRLEKDYFEELIAEKIVLSTNKYGLPVKTWFRPPHTNNEAFDTMILSWAAKESLNNINIEYRLQQMTNPEPVFDMAKASRDLHG